MCEFTHMHHHWGVQGWGGGGLFWLQGADLENTVSQNSYIIKRSAFFWKKAIIYYSVMHRNNNKTGNKCITWFPLSVFFSTEKWRKSDRLHYCETHAFVHHVSYCFVASKKILLQDNKWITMSIARVLKNS